ncbi:MAG TPA: FAD/NAD(P)-binding protein [Polyangia bacterium]|nr:FAD/NAD(P)-binding protein [Polyangia bacterium]
MGTQPQLTPNLTALRDHLSRIERPDGAALAAALAAPITFDDVRGFVRFDDESYVRALIYRDERLELRLHCWRPGQSTSLHGHGASACAFKILRGTATETVLGDRDRVWAPGSVVVENAPRFHQVMNAGRDPLLTLHAYSPPLAIDAPSSPSGRQVVIVGGGFAGAAVAYHLLREMDGDGRIHLVEMGPWLGRGIAYGVESEIFRLNVPASRMSIDPETPDDFVTFSGSEAAPHAFLGRALYARYVTARLAARVKSSVAKLRMWRDEAVSVSRDAVMLRGGATLPAEAVVLATGIVPRVKHASFHPRVVDAWDECALATLPMEGRLLLLGSGLSALDVLAFLDAQGFAGEVTLISPRGLLPLAHELEFQGTPPLAAADVARAPKALRPLVRWVRQTIASAIAGGLPWQRAVDSLRPHIAGLYRALPHADRASFVRHVRPYWDVFRHRAPADALERVGDWARAGRLRRLAGRVKIDRRGDASSVTVTIRARAGGERHERFDAVVRCVGPALDVADAATPLLQSLVDGGLAALGASGLGIETTTDGRVVDARGEASHRIFGLGAVRRACDWETTSVPDIAKHAQQIAREIARRSS